MSPTEGPSVLPAMRKREADPLPLVCRRVHIPPFDNPLIVDGHSTMVAEIEEQLVEQQASAVAAVICSAGGGGLLGGVSSVKVFVQDKSRQTNSRHSTQIIKGMTSTNGRFDCPIIACETSGAASLAFSLKSSHAAGAATLSRLPEIRTIATSIGASQVSAECLDRCLAHEAGVVSVVMEDVRALDIVRQFTGRWLHASLSRCSPGN